MNVTLTSLEALMLKATHESLPCPDAAALEAFCKIMKDSPEGAMFAAQTLASRIHAPNAREALLALMMLDRCMRRCDASFHAEVGKFRFLNEMIKLVSPKYFANRTAPEVRTRVLQLLHAWSIEYPKETKFKVAYDMLKNQGVVKETPPPLPPEDTPPPPRLKSAIFEDEEKSKLLQKLLQSKKPEDLQHANRLIKTMVREEERRTFANNRRAQEVGTALDSAGLLSDMLERSADASDDEEQLIHELHASCKSQKIILQQMAAAEPMEEHLNDILHAIDELDEVFARYNSFVANKKTQPKLEQTQASNSESLLDFAGANVANKQTASKPETDVMEELGDIFSSDDAIRIAEPLKPVNLMSCGDVDLLGEKSEKREGWNELDSLGEQLLKQSLPNNAKRVENFNSKSTKKIPMKELEKSSPKHEVPLNSESMLDLDFFSKKPDEQPNTKPIFEPLQTALDDIMVDLSTTNVSNNNNINNSSTQSQDNILDLGLPNNVKEESIVENKERVENKDTQDKKGRSEVKPLSDINVTLQSVQPSKLPPMTVFEEEGGMTVVLHFCKDKPRPDVNVIVISSTSKSSSPIEDYKFQAVVPKGSKVRLLTPSGTSLPAFNPFLPPPAITQVMLIARPSSQPAYLKFVITYTSDEETTSEMGEVKQLPLDDI